MPALQQARGRVPSWLAGGLALLAAVCALTALIHPLRLLLGPVLAFVDDWIVPATPNLAYAAFLGLLATAVAARKRAAWWFVAAYWALVVVAAALVLALERDVSAVAALAVALAALAVLLWARPAFTARVRRFAAGRALGVLVLGLALAVLLGWGLVAAFPGTLGPGHRLPWAASSVLGGLVDAGRFDGRPPRAVSFTCGLLGALALLAAASTLFRSQKARTGLHPDDETRLRALLARHGGQDSLGYFATRRDKNVVFSASGKAAVTYRVEAGVCLASGDPVGDPEAWGPAIDTWLRAARHFGWTPAVMGAGEDGARAYTRAGLGALQLGDEAVLDLAAFDLSGRTMRPVRQAVGRVARTGARVTARRHSTLSEQEMARIVALAEEWRGGESERGFSMALSRLGDPADGECLLLEAFDGENQPVGLLSFVPWGADGVSLDLMRRAPQAPNGLNEFMIAELADQAESLGLRRVSLNFAVFRSAFEEGGRLGAGPVLRLWRRVLLFASRWWQLEALYRSNVKYQPRWQPRFLCYAEPRLLARIAFASGVAEGFVELPLAGRSRRGVTVPVSHQDLPPLTGEQRALAAAGATGAGEAPSDEAPAGAARARTPEQVRVRMAKRERLAHEGTDPYPADVHRTHRLAAVRGMSGGEAVSVAGRVLLVRDHGGIVFATLRDWSGDLQLLFERDELGAGSLRRLMRDVDLGDHLAVTGVAARSERGEPSVRVRDWRLTAKCLRPLPDKWRGLADPEVRVRRRYLDLAVSTEARETVRARGAAVRALREGLLRRDFLEVETPMLQQIHGGANARPFTTHINAYDLDLYLRIAPELYLKRLCVGGVERVFELGRTFRNEGTSYKHNPEFTMLEAYQAYADYDDMLVLVRELIQGAATAAWGSPIARKAGKDGRLAQHDISGEWPVKTVFGAISEALGTEVGPDSPIEGLRTLCDRAHVPYTPAMGHGDVVLEMYERLVEERTGLPTFYKDFPTDVSPLTRQHRRDPRLAERWDLVAFGTELGTAYSELVDPVEQRRRLTAQSLLAAGGDPEAMELDEDFLTALEYAMPPTGGLGVGVDRLVMFLTGRTIRETLPFPLVRASTGSAGGPP